MPSWHFLSERAWLSLTDRLCIRLLTFKTCALIRFSPNWRRFGTETLPKKCQIVPESGTTLCALSRIAGGCGKKAENGRMNDGRSSTTMTPGARLRAAWSAGPIMIPGAFNALVARMAERLGSRPSISRGARSRRAGPDLPDIGLLTQTEFAEQAAVLARATALPVLCDADTGFGEAINVERTVRLYEEAGVGGAASRRSGLAQALRASFGESAGRFSDDGKQGPGGREGAPRSRFRDRGADRRAKRRGLRRGRAPGTRIPGRRRRHDLPRSPRVGRRVRSLCTEPSTPRCWRI